MADRILTKGLKTGTGAGGVKYILMRGLISTVLTIIIPETARHIFTVDRERRIFTLDKERRIFNAN